MIETRNSYKNFTIWFCNDNETFLDGSINPLYIKDTFYGSCDGYGYGYGSKTKTELHSVLDSKEVKELVKQRAKEQIEEMKHLQKFNSVI